MSPSPFTTGQLARALLLVLTKLLDRIVTRWHLQAWMIECVSRQSGSMLPSMVVMHLQNCTWRTSPLMWVAMGCGQTRCELTPILTCSGCRVARFCSADHQKMASKKATLMSLWTGRHKDICGVLSKWREVVKDGVAPESCTADLVAFLQR